MAVRLVGRAGVDIQAVPVGDSHVELWTSPWLALLASAGAARAGASVWSSVPSCTAFTQRFGVTLQKVQRGLLADRQEANRLRDVLVTNAVQLERTDQDIQDRLVALARRLEVEPVVEPAFRTPFDDERTHRVTEVIAEREITEQQDAPATAGAAGTPSARPYLGAGVRAGSWEDLPTGPVEEPDTDDDAW